MALRGFAVRAGAGALALGLLASPAGAQRRDVVDLELVLAVDISRSMDEDEQRTQRQGYVEAFRHPALLNAIRAGTGGRIAVTYVEWAEQAQQTIPWTIISNAAEAAAFAAKLEEAPLYTERRTSISTAIDYSVDLLEGNLINATRRVIDISGDGPNNYGRGIIEARDAAVARKITINGIPLLMNQPSQYSDFAELDKYYRDCVIGGQGAFVMPVKTMPAFAATIRAKLVSEVAGIAPREGPGEPRFQLAQAVQRPAPQKTDCMAGERRGFGGYGGYGYPPPEQIAPRITP
jgi:hypothetical protein